MKQDLNGKWTGKLTYGGNFGHLEHEALFFTLELEQHGDEFAGISRDVDGIGIHPSQTKVSGFLEDGQINFVRACRFSALLDHTAPEQMDKNGPEAEISFSGSYNPLTGEFEGEWLILASYVIYSNLFFESENGGNWSMKRDLL